MTVSIHLKCTVNEYKIKYDYHIKVSRVMKDSHDQLFARILEADLKI